MKLFVYGTLLRGGVNHERLVRNGCKFISSAITQPKYSMFHNGAYPAITDGTQRIKGEIYSVPDAAWESLDGLEGTDSHFYDRHTDNVQGQDVEIYFGVKVLQRGNWISIPSGNYRDVAPQIKHY